MKIKAFTLVELLVVIAIIGILSSVVVVNYSSSKAKARDAKRKTDLMTIQSALELYYADKKTYPSDKSEPTIQANVFLPVEGLPEIHNYLQQIPKDPKDNVTDYQYAYFATPQPNSTCLAPFYVLKAQIDETNIVSDTCFHPGEKEINVVGGR
ncbi:MAG: type II secretion system protein GspG [Patescibacteria group bacterium]|nr:type II secretion system protein GspG [Patescibacteria group bacterium]